MAIGLGRMLGCEFLENFNAPYISASISEFWRRWHISLSNWMREYLYIPLGGNRCGPARCAMNLWIVFFLSGLWHGAAWNFIVWGLYHGLGIIFVNKLQKYLRRRRQAKGIKNQRLPDSPLVKVIKIFLTANYFFFGYIIISQDSFLDTIRICQIILFGWMEA